VRVLISLFLIASMATASSPASVEEAMQLYSAGRKLEARRLLEQIVQAQPTNFEAHFRLGLLALDSHDLPPATATLRRASQLQPSHPQVWLALAQAYQKSNQTKLSAEAAARAEALAPGDPVILHGLAMIHSEGGRWAKAATLEARYASKTPEDRGAVVRAVTWHLQAGQPKPAIQLATRALAKEKRAELHNLLGKAYEADGQFDKTIIELQEAIKLSPRQESYYFDLAYVLLLHQNFDVAIQILEASKEIFDKSAQLELALGIANYGQRKFAEAVDAFLRTIELEPKFEQPYVFLARILNHAEGRLDEVTARFARFAQANPKNYLGHFLHAKGLIAEMGPSPSGELATQAEQLLKKSISLNPNFWESNFELGVLLEGKKDFAAAARHLERAVQLSPRAPAPHYRLARVYDRLGKADAAQAERVLHEKLTAEERTAIEKHAAGLKRLELVVK
jgi:tetratricopeptide (TPR) repeat protein